jgi:hypothetical protein
MLLLIGCSTVTYQTEEWRMIVPEKGDARAVVRYVGVGTASTDPAARERAATRIKELAQDQQPSKPFAAPLKNVQRRVYMENDKIVLEESGTVPNPLTWGQQSGLNPFNWFSGQPKLVERGNYIVKRDVDDTGALLASDGRIVDEDTYTRLLRDGQPVGITTDTRWQRHEDEPLPDEVRRPRAEIIVWPRDARAFYWKQSGAGFDKSWQSLAREYEAVSGAKQRRAAVPASLARPAEDTTTFIVEPVAAPARTVALDTDAGAAPAAAVKPTAAEPMRVALPEPEPEADFPELATPSTSAAPSAAAMAADTAQQVATAVTNTLVAVPQAAAAAAETGEPAPPSVPREFSDDTPLTPLLDDDTIK